MSDPIGRGPATQTRDSPPDLATLADRVRGRVFGPDDPGYAEECTGFQRGFIHHPDVVVVAEEPEDVAAAVAFAAEQGLPIVAQATGHGTSVPLAGGVLVNTRKLDRVQIRPDSATAVIEAGVRWEQVMLAAETYGLAPVSGSSPGVGAVSYTLGGGLGVLSRQFGYASDHVRAISVVGADATVTPVTATSDPDLFYALRGGRANFGIVTSMEVGLVPVRKLYGADYFYDGDAPAEYLTAYRDWSGGQPENLASAVSIIQMPDVDGVPDPLRGRRVIHLCIAYTGPTDEAEALVAPMRDLRPVLMGSAEQMPPTKTGTIFKEPPFPHAYYGTNAMLTELADPAIAAMAASTDLDRAVPLIIDVRHLGGAAARPGDVPSAVGHRGAQYVARILTPLGGYELADVVATHDQLYRDLGGHALGRTPNFLYGVTPTPEIMASCYDPADYARLLELKHRYDPTNLFRAHQPLTVDADTTSGTDASAAEPH